MTLLSISSWMDIRVGLFTVQPKSIMIYLAKWTANKEHLAQTGQPLMVDWLARLGLLGSMAD